MPEQLNFRSAALRICVDACEDGHLSGRILAQQLAAPLVFSDVSQLILLAEETLNKKNFPQAFQRIRTFSNKERSHIPDDQPAKNAGTATAPDGQVCTFVLYVISRCNTTWQGKVDWLDGAPPQPFESVLELIKYLDTRLS